MAGRCKIIEGICYNGPAEIAGKHEFGNRDSRLGSYFDSKSRQVAGSLLNCLHSQGTPGGDAGTGWTQYAILTFGDGTQEGEIAEYPARLSGGTLLIDGQSIENEIPLPLDRTGDAELRLEVVNHDSVVIRGSEVHLVLRGTPTYVEEFPGDTA